VRPNGKAVQLGNPLWFASLCVGLLALPPSAGAQETPPEAQPSATATFSADQARDLARLEALIASHATEARNQRLAVGSIFLATGLAAVPVGVVAQASWHQDYGVGLWVSGALLLGFGALALFVESPLERLQTSFLATATLAPATRLAFGEGALANAAASAHGGRTIGAIVNFAFAGLFAGIAIGQLVSAQNNTGSDRTNLQDGAATSFVLGGLFVGLGVTSLVFETPTETAYDVYVSGKAPASPGVRLSAGVAPVHGGGILGLSGAF
jgi:type IV secretory pathway TrbD component